MIGGFLFLLNSLGGVMDIKYPETKKVDVVDTIFGTRVPDPYRWLEDLKSPEVQAWIKKQNKLTLKVLRSIPVWKTLLKEFENLFRTTTVHYIFPVKNRYFFMKKEGLKNHPVLYYVDGKPDVSKGKVVVDPNKFSRSGLVSLDWYRVSRDGKYIAFGKSEGGTENSTLYVKEIDTGRMLPDTIPNTKWASLVWTPDNSGFFYSRNTSREKYLPHIYFHKLGEPYEKDKYIFGEGLSETEIPDVSASSDREYLFINVSHGWIKNDVYFRSMNSSGEFTPLFVGKNGFFDVDHLDGHFIVLTTYNAPKGRILSIPVDSIDEEHWKEIIPERDFVIEYFRILGKRIVLIVKKDTYTKLLVYKPDGEFMGDIPLPGKGVAGVSGEWDNPVVIVRYQSILQPPIIFTYNLDTGERHVIWEMETGDFNPEEYEQKLVFYKSKDSTSIPMFIVHKKGIKLDGSNPVLLTGYGGFSVGISPYFMRNLVPLLKRGIVFAYPGIRGGDEYGEEWHRDGMLSKKQNVFDDFIAAGEYLIDKGYTSPEKLVISGGSNGGLLVGAVMVQRPDLFKAVVCSVPLLDMIRYHKFLVAHLWTAEYGNPDKKEDFEYLIKYSPYHNVSPDKTYPAVLFWTAEGDSRVHPMHAMKMAAKLQELAKPERPVLLYVEPQAGHGAGKPLKKSLEDTALRNAFILWQLGIDK